MKSRPLGAGQSILATQNNDKRDDGRGGSFLLAHQQLGALALGTAPTNGQTVSFVINGTTITATAASTPTNANDIKNPGTALGFATNVLNWLRRPDISNSNQIAASSANQQLLQYVGWAWPGSSTTIVPFSLNKNVNAITGLLTSFNITTTVTSGSWTAQTMQLYVEDGTYYIGGTRYLFTGGSTATVTAPVSNPRIDVLTINSSGVLAWTTGTESASPVAPAYPANQVPICELYNVVSETVLYDNENEQSGQGYILNDVRPTMSYGIPFAAVPDSILPAANNTYNLGSGSFQWNAVYANAVYQNGALAAPTKFGGTGASGALSITSGTTTLTLGSANYYEANYSSISITGTGALTFSGPSANGCIVVLKSTGNVTLTSSATALIVGDGLGAAAGNDGWALTGVGPKTAHTITIGVYPSGAGSPTSEPYSIGAQGANLVSSAFSRSQIFSGSGGQAGAGVNNGAGAPGGLGIAIECGGALNFTGTISSVGGSGASGTGSGTWSGFAIPGGPGGTGNTNNGDTGSSTFNSVNYKTGGGGGGGGCVVILYNTLTANSGIITVTGGLGGSTSVTYPGQAGTAGFSYIGANTLFP